MVKSKAKAPTLYGSVPFVLAASDVATAISLGLQRNETPMNMTDYRLPDYVVGHAKKRNIGVDSYASQQAVQQRCKQFACSVDFSFL
ncbi:hypothetical protein JG687_00007998 [Phytophthora cactorum]|uniref:Uncharacterized protein n=1 Tax=Phytophthora cactorum TaxID=29920 RepID=A0A8T1UIR8_9STRA|nr:hypothetical protein Pcac1_g5496 [Phytophthora cactorum]KAG2856672.1 hypothetical protein PC113_g11361 [Phytophthora cactorum]KAG2904346.1 hypothetical protein PC114_g11886 [Phytophthora cactorum]KAG2942485.1 hypothetical protein PC117_g9761 [Phytophthora cactorum]KAG2981324.1 hypothetical protein PC118_g10682 [Phytophthora cactorum]